MTAAFYWETSTTDTCTRPWGLEKSPLRRDFLHLLHLQQPEGISKVIEGVSLCNARESSLPAHSAWRNDTNGELEENGAQAAEGQDCSCQTVVHLQHFLCVLQCSDREAGSWWKRCSGALLQLQWKARVRLPPQLHAKSSFSQRSRLGWQLYLWAKTDQPVQHIYKETSLLATHQVRKNKIICGLASKINSQFCSVLRYEYFINHYLRNSKNSPTERVGENGKGKILIN